MSEGLLQLSVDALSYVFTFLTEPKDVFSALLVCRKFAQACVVAPHAIFHDLWEPPVRADRPSELLEVLRWPRFRGVRRLTVSGAVDDAVVRAIASELPQLHSLGIVNVVPGKMSALAFSALEDHAGLRCLRVHQCTAAGEEALASLCKLPCLEELYLSALPQSETESWLALLEAHPRLRKLALRNVGLMHDVIPLSGSTGNEDAESYNASSITPRIAALTELVHLDLHTSQWLSSRGLSIILPQLTRVEFLNLSWSGVTDSALALLPGSVRQLSLNRCHISDVGCGHIADRLPELRSLRLNLNSEVTDTGLRRLVDGCPMLEAVELQKCRSISDVSLRTLSELHGLRHLDLFGVTPENFTAEAVIYLLDEREHSLERLRLPWQLSMQAEVKNHPAVV